MIFTDLGSCAKCTQILFLKCTVFRSMASLCASTCARSTDIVSGLRSGCLLSSLPYFLLLIPPLLVVERNPNTLFLRDRPSSEVLTHFLARYLSTLGRERVKGMRVLELGCGVGLPGIFCALQGCDVTLTDKEEVCLPRFPPCL